MVVLNLTKKGLLQKIKHTRYALLNEDVCVVSCFRTLQMFHYPYFQMPYRTSVRAKYKISIFENLIKNVECGKFKTQNRSTKGYPLCM